MFPAPLLPTLSDFDRAAMERSGGHLIPYAATVGKGRNQRGLCAAGWSFLCQPDWVQSHGQPYALDNGAYRAFLRGQSLDVDAFAKSVDRFGENAQFVVLPDIVCGGAESLDLSLSWLNRLADLPTRKLIAVQDGHDWNSVASFVADDVGIFLGGSTEWKLMTMPYWGARCRASGIYLHVGRVNSVKRVRMCLASGANSFDGSGVSRFAVELPRIDFYRRQSDMFAGVFPSGFPVTPGLCAMDGSN